MDFGYEIDLNFENDSNSSESSESLETELSLRNSQERNLLHSSLDLNVSLEIPHIPNEELFVPLVEEEHVLSFETLPTDILRNIAMNLNYESFVQLTSTCKKLQQLENDERVMRTVCNISDQNVSIEQCVETVKNRKRDERIEKKRKKEMQREKKIEKFENFALCNRRICSNVIFEHFSLGMLFVATLIAATSLDRRNDIPMIVPACLLFFPTLFYGVMPYFLCCWGCMVRNEHENMESPNRDIKIYGGFFDYFNQLFLWSKRMGFRPLKYSFVLATWILFLLWSLELIQFGFVLIPAAVYTFIYWFTFTIDFGLYKYHGCRLNGHRCLVYTPTTLMICVGLILTMLRSFGVFSNYYTLTMLPFSFAIISYPILLTCRCCFFSSFNSKRSCPNYGCCRHVWHAWGEIETNYIDTESLLQKTLTVEAYFASIVALFFPIFLSILLDGICDWQFTNVFIPVYLLIFFYAIVQQLTVFIQECAFDGGIQCCPEIFPTNWDRIRWLCCEDCTNNAADECSCILSPIGKICSLFLTIIGFCCSCFCDMCSCCCSWLCSHICCCCADCCSWLCNCFIDCLSRIISCICCCC